jgi:hypothetical protein
MKRQFALLAAVVTLVAMAAQPVAAARPVIVTEVIDVTETVTDRCSFPVDVHVTGHIRVATYTNKAGVVVRELTNYALHVTYSANGKTVSVVNTGPDRVRDHGDGSFTLAITGNVELTTGPGAGVVAGTAGQTLLLFTPAVDEDGNPIFLVDVLKDAGARPGGDLCELLAA